MINKIRKFKKNRLIFLVSPFILLVVLASIYSFLYRKENRTEIKKISISGEQVFPSGLIIGEDELLIIEPGTKIRMGKDQQILILGKIIAHGTNDNPIIFEASEDYWRGIRIEGGEKIEESSLFWEMLSTGDKEKQKEYIRKVNNGSVFTNCIFKDVSTQSREFFIGNKWKAALETYGTTVNVSDSKFENILHVGGFLAKNSFIKISNNTFNGDTIHKDINLTDQVVGIVNKNNIIHNRNENKPCADGIWIKDSAVIVNDNTLEGIADDAIQASNSKAIISNNTIKKTQENGIDLDGPSGKYIVFDNNISNIEKSALMISNQAKLVLVKNNFHNAKEAITLRDGAKIAASELELVDNNTGIKTEQTVPCEIEANEFQYIKEKLEKISNSEFEELHMENIEDKEGIIEKLNKFYSRKKNYLHLTNINDNTKGTDIATLSEIFRIPNLNIPTSIKPKTATNNSDCKKLINSVHISSSKFQNNKKDTAINGEYKLQLSDMIYSSQQNKNDTILKMSASFTCPLSEELDVWKIKSNLREISNNGIK